MTSTWNNVKHAKNQKNYYATIAQMEYAGLDTASIVNNTLASGQASRRKKIRTCGSDHFNRKQSVRDRLRKKLKAKATSGGGKPSASGSQTRGKQ